MRSPLFRGTPDTGELTFCENQECRKYSNVLYIVTLPGKVKLSVCPACYPSYPVLPRRRRKPRPPKPSICIQL